MVLHYRKRGAVWHVRGTIRVGRQVIRVPEHSTGCRIKAEAEAVGAAEEARLRAEAIEATAPRARAVTIGECIAIYRARPGDHHPFDEARCQRAPKSPQLWAFKIPWPAGSVRIGDQPAV